MGQVIGIAAKTAKQRVTRPLRHYNVEERAMKVISRDKPIPAPAHPSMKQVMEDIMRDPAKLKSDRTDPHMLKKLSNVYITSQGSNPEIIGRRRNLPTDRANYEGPLFGYEDPKVVPPGKASLRQLLEIVSKHSEDPENYTPEMIAKEFKLDIVDVMNLVSYYRALLIFRPPPVEKKKERNPLKRLQAGIDNLKN